MNVYALPPLIATIAYIPLLITTAGSRPWQKRHYLFILFLVAAMLWSLIVYLLRSNLFPDHNGLLFKLAVILFAVTAVQFHCFTSSFYPQGKPLVSLCIFIPDTNISYGYIGVCNQPCYL